ncbi:M15 family metallopeptidase [Salirhabdus salicampi]|uniref:M15 family metallopeptidase n=1 Tax=Salirhabdus salicampi TaxID=476102 RepID=UPI0020C538E2|nr:M15 family metallopeptidase [Salirhabdus salicampi]MCP8617703.1 M15 family metallopeptidase [Salirhabdus salicampi]
MMSRLRLRIWTFIVIVSLLIITLVIRNEWELRNTPLPTSLHPVVAGKAERLVERSDEMGISVVITEGFRSFDKQNELYNRGRTDDGNIVTYAKGGESYHNYGLAIDFAIRNSNGEVIWDLRYDGNANGKSDWMEVVQIAKELGFEWGGDWSRFKDYPHLQMDFGLTIRDLQRGKRP